MQAVFAMAETGFRISIGLTGMLCLWLGVMKIGESAGAIGFFARFTAPFFSRIFPEIPRNHPVFGSMVMNFSANMLGLDNSATPLGLKAMKELQALNPNPNTASNSQIMFLVLNTSGLTLIPVSILVYRSQMGAANPSDIFLPILIATYASTLAGLLLTSYIQKVKLFNPVVLAWLGGISSVIAIIIWTALSLDSSRLEYVSGSIANFVLFAIICGFILLGVIKKIAVYEAFTEGAKEGFKTAVTIIPYLVAMLVAIAAFRASGLMDVLIQLISTSISLLGLPTDFVEALPTAIMKPLSGSGARGMMIETMQTHGADSFVGRLASTFQGSTETTFYVLAVYFGSVAVRNSRHALFCGLFADLAGILAAIFAAYLFFPV
jgi:spore maturation protein SpmA